jgi:hypothetical protein
MIDGTLEALLQQLVKELDDQPAIGLYDGQMCKVIPVVLADAIIKARAAVRDTPQPQPAAVTVDDVGDAVCQHGTAMDVHCCNCHSGFIFDMHHECPVSSMADAAEMLWVVLANVSGGDWTKQSTDWQEAQGRPRHPTPTLSMSLH